MLRLAVAGVLLGLTSCATMFNPGPDTIMVSTEPPGAVVRLDGINVGRSPCALSVPRDATGLLLIELDGFHAQEVEMKQVFNGVGMLNALWGLPLFIIPALIDAAAGNALKWSETPMLVHLVPASETPRARLFFPGSGTEPGRPVGEKAAAEAEFTAFTTFGGQ